KIAYGHAYGNESAGMIVYEASHSIQSGNASVDIAAARVYGNFLLLAGIETRPTITVAIPQTTLRAGATMTGSASVTTCRTPYTFNWTDTAGGTFANPYAATTTYPAPAVTGDTYASISVAITDSCSRHNFAPTIIVVKPKAEVTLQKTTCNKAVIPGESYSYT